MLKSLLRRPPPLPPWRYRLTLCAPAALALLAPPMARLLPTEAVWAVALASLLLSAPPFLMALWPLVALALGRRQRRILGPAAAGIAGLILMGRPPPLWPPAPAGGVRLASANVNAYSPDADRRPMERALGALDADVLLVIERGAEAVPGMYRAADNFDEPLPMQSHAAAVFCRLGSACEAEITPEFGSATWQMPLALVRLPGDICVLGIHGPPPVPYDAVGLHHYVATLADHLDEGRISRAWGPCEPGDGAVVVGDLNAVPGSRPWQALVNKGLTDHLSGSGVWGASWPAGGGWPWAPFFRLDQALGGAAAVGGITHHAIPGADHRAVALTVAPLNP